jgi:hypothetical protein
MDISATNWTFVTKYEFESNCLTTATKELKLNHCNVLLKIADLRHYFKFQEKI